MKFRSNGVSLLQRWERLVRAKGMTPPPGMYALQLFPPPPLLRREGHAVDYRQREERMLHHFLKKYPYHFQDIVGRDPEQQATIAREFVRRQIGLVKRGFSEEDAFERVDHEIRPEMSEIMQRLTTLFKLSTAHASRPRLSAQPDMKSSLREFVRAMNFELAYKKALGWTDPSLPSSSPDANLEHLLKTMFRQSPTSKPSEAEAGAAAGSRPGGGKGGADDKSGKGGGKGRRPPEAEGGKGKKATESGAKGKKSTSDSSPKAKK